MFKLKQSWQKGCQALLLLVFLSAIPAPIQAAKLEPYWGKPVQPAVALTAAPGEEVAVNLDFKNTGSVTWTSTGRRFASVYTIKPRYHASALRASGWISSGQPARLATSSVKTGQVGTVAFKIKAPAKPGTYSDVFQMASEDTSWIWGAFATVKLTVRPAPVVAAAPSAAVPVPQVPGTAAVPEELQGQLVFRSAERLEGPGGMDFTLRTTFKNLGTAAWKKPAIRLVSAKSADGSDVSASADSWASPEIAAIVNELVAPRSNVDINLTVRTPAKKGEYQLRFQLVAEGAALASAPLDLPIRVMSDAPPSAVPQEDVTTAPQGEPTEPPVSTSAGEPLVRVGLYVSDKQEEIGSDGPFEARDANDAVLARFAAGSRVRFWYDPAAAAYRVAGPGQELVSAGPVRFVQTGSAQFFTVWSLEKRPKWNLTLNDNTFRGVIELRKNDRNEYVWLIDELPMEQYLRGLGETSDVSPAEFQKALAAAARTYAYWHWSNPGKHWHFTVDATYDQVYLGYNAEIRLPHWVAALEATRGRLVTYGGTVVVTPYFTWSDGRTRSWTEVWGGAEKPWLQSIACDYDAAAGRTLFGHGVGMSAWDAIGRANSGADWIGILGYYYQGTGLKAAY